jgi:hypothetical protein
MMIDDTAPDPVAVCVTVQRWANVERVEVAISV